MESKGVTPDDQYVEYDKNGNSIIIPDEIVNGLAVNPIIENVPKVPDDMEIGGVMYIDENNNVFLVEKPNISTDPTKSYDTVLNDKLYDEESEYFILGLWHTHPIDSPPSIEDIEYAKEVDYQVKLVGDSILFHLVITPEHYYWYSGN